MKLVYRLLIYIPLFIISAYAFTLLHECGHAIAAILTGNGVEAIELYIDGGGLCRVIWDNYEGGAGVVYIAGSLSTLLVCVPLFIYSLWKKKPLVLYVLFVQIIKELHYWATSPARKWGDAHLTIEWAGFYEYNGIIDTVYSASICSWVAIVLVIVLFIYLFYRLFKNLYEKRYYDLYGR